MALNIHCQQAPVWGAEQMDEISNQVLNEGANPLQAQILALVEFFSDNGIKLRHEESSYWRVVEPEGSGIKVSLRTFPRRASEQQMRSALQRLNLAYILNPHAFMSMSCPIGNSEHDTNEIGQKLQKLFLDYRLPKIWKPAVYSRYDKVRGVASLYANEVVLLDESIIPRFEFQELWKYGVETSIWTRVPIEAKPVAINSPRKRQIYSGATDQELVKLTTSVGLFWAKWKEDDRQVGAFVYAGPVLCNDVMLGPEPPGMVAVCVPFPDSARAMFVPDPTVNCK